MYRSVTTNLKNLIQILKKGHIMSMFFMKHHVRTFRKLKNIILSHYSPPLNSLSLEELLIIHKSFKQKLSLN